MELPRLIVLTCVLGVSAALCYARGAPARELPAPSPAVLTAAFPPAPAFPSAVPAASAPPTDSDVSATKHPAAKPKTHKRRSPRR